jgi:integrase
MKKRDELIAVLPSGDVLVNDPVPAGIPATLTTRLVKSLAKAITDPETAFGDDAYRAQAIHAAASNTIRAWRNDWRIVCRFVDQLAWEPSEALMERLGFIDREQFAIRLRTPPVQPEIIQAFIDYYSPMSDRQLRLKRQGRHFDKASKPYALPTMRRLLATVSKWHRMNQLPDPTNSELVRDTLKEFSRDRGGSEQAARIRWADILAFLKLEPDEVKRIALQLPAAPKERYPIKPNPDKTKNRGRPATGRHKPYPPGSREFILEQLGSPGRLLRAKTMLTVAFNLMSRREELVALTWGDISDSMGIAGAGTAMIGKTKTNPQGVETARHLSQTAMHLLKEWKQLFPKPDDVEKIYPLFCRFYSGREDKIGIPIRPVESLPYADWPQEPYGEALSEAQCNRIFKACMQAIGKEGDVVKQISGHSCRVGAAQDLANSGMSLLEIMQSGGWTSTAMPARYIRKQAADESGMAKAMSGMEQFIAAPLGKVD